MKTAMQTLLEDIELLMPRTYKVLKNKFELETFYLEKEKQQIIETCIKTTQDCWISSAEALGLNLVFTDEDLINQKEEAVQYYNETYEAKKSN